MIDNIRTQDTLTKQDRFIEKRDKYESFINAYPNLLTRNQESDLLEILAKYSSGIKRDKAQENLIMSNYRLILKQASLYKNSTILPLDDLVSAGLQGLVTAINRYSSGYKTRLSTYAVPWIKVFILRLITSFNSATHIPSHIVNKRSQYVKTFNESMINSMTEVELMDALSVSKKMLGDIKASHVSSSISLDSNCINGEECRPISEIIADTKVVTPSMNCENKDDNKFLHKAVSKLDKVAKDIITRRYLTDEKEDLNAVGKSYNITGERVRQIECQALKLLQKRLKNVKLFNK